MKKFLLGLKLAIHVIPVVGIFFFGWDPLTPVMLFNFESFFLILGLWALVIYDLTMGNIGNFIVGTLGVITMGIFNLVHFVLSVLMFGTTDSKISWGFLQSNLEYATRQSWYWLILMAIDAVVIILFLFKGIEKDFDSLRDCEAFALRIGRRIFVMQFAIIFFGAIGKITHNNQLAATMFLLMLFYLDFS